MKRILEEAKKLHTEMITARRYFHQNPELHVHLPMTTKYVMEKLIEYGYAPVEIAQSGIVAIACGKKPGKTFLIRGDMDALPIREETTIDFKSKNAYMHACGHDLHTAMMLGAAKLLKTFEDDIEGTVKLMFQPAEETLTGAKMMIDAGLLDNPKVNGAMMIHVSTGTTLPNDTVVFLGKGPVTASVDIFEIKIQGKGGHGAMPHSTIDPLTVASHLHIALGAINSREVEPGEVAVLTIGELHGGDAPNIIPDTAYMKGTIRTYSSQVREQVLLRLSEITDGIAKTFRCTAQVTSKGCPSVVNDPDLFNSALKYAKELFPAHQVLDVETVLGEGKRISASEDFGFLSREVPTLLLAIGSDEAEDGQIYPHHHPKVRFDENTLITGAALYANTAIEWLKEHQ